MPNKEKAQKIEHRNYEGSNGKCQPSNDKEKAQKIEHRNLHILRDHLSNYTNR